MARKILAEHKMMLVKRFRELSNCQHIDGWVLCGIGNNICSRHVFKIGPKFFSADCACNKPIDKLKEVVRSGDEWVLP